MYLYLPVKLYHFRNLVTKADYNNTLDKIAWSTCVDTREGRFSIDIQIKNCWFNVVHIIYLRTSVLKIDKTHE